MIPDDDVVLEVQRNTGSRRGRLIDRVHDRALRRRTRLPVFAEMEFTSTSTACFPLGAGCIVIDTPPPYPSETLLRTMLPFPTPPSVTDSVPNPPAAPVATNTPPPRAKVVFAKSFLATFPSIVLFEIVTCELTVALAVPVKTAMPPPDAPTVPSPAVLPTHVLARISTTLGTVVAAAST